MFSKQMPTIPNAVLDRIPFRGGLDLVTPPWDVEPGKCRDAQNYEIGIEGGYDYISGYERYDGQTKPSDAQYGILDVTITGSIEVDDTITGATSGATAVVLSVITTETPNYLVVSKISGTFQSETLNVSGSPEGTITGPPVLNGASTTLLNAQYTNLAADEYRSDITAVTGSGSILGVWVLSDIVYAVRNNAGGTAAAIYKSSGAGWTLVALGRELSFTSGGTYEIEEGDTITGATSSATAEITRVILESGTWAGGDAAGRLIFASQTGTFQSENLDVGGNSNVATIAADSSAITLLPGGRYETVKHNFGGLAGADRIYGCDGVNRGFEFDGTVFAPIDTGMTTDTPKHVAAHKNHLFFSFEGSAQHSGIGTPYIFSPVYGAGELAVGDTITGFQTESGAQATAALGIYSRNSTHILYGTSASDWNLVKYREKVGAIEYTIQQIDSTIFLDDRGIRRLNASDAYGNFSHATLTNKLKTWVNTRRDAATASCILRDKNQYRLFYSDGYCLCATLDGDNVLGFMPLLFDDHATCVISEEDTSGDEVIYFGSDNGFVYQMEKGTSFDGGAIDTFLLIHYYHGSRPRITKTYKGCTLEIRGNGYNSLNFSYELGYGTTELPQPTPVATSISLSSVYWDSFTWDNFTWDGRTLEPTQVDVEGTAENISLIIRGSSDYNAPIKISGAIIRNIIRRNLR